MSGKAKIARDIFETALSGKSASAKRRTMWTKKGWRRQTQREADDEAAGMKKWLEDAEADPWSLKIKDIDPTTMARLKRAAGTASAVGAAGLGAYVMRDSKAASRRK